MLRALFAAFALVVLSADPGAAQRRVALLVGVAEYQNLRSMVRPSGDAKAVEQTLTRLGFEASSVIDVDGRDLATTVDRFVDGLQQGDVALVHFSGHGARADGDFLLLAADATAHKPDSGLTDGAQGLHALAERITAAGARAELIIDACRGDAYSAGPDLGPSS